MASSCKASLISCKISPTPSTTYTKQNRLHFKSNINPHKWSISYQNKIILSTPSNHLINLPNKKIIDIEDEICIKFDEKLRGFKHILSKAGDEQDGESLTMIDAIQRLGIDYHFQDEIDEILRRQYNNYHTRNCCFDGINLHEITLRFRLLRQHGYYLPAAGMLDKFKTNYGRIKQNLSDDIKGLMGLYEASQLSIGGEDYILDEAGDYSYNVLSSWVKRFNHNQARIVKNTIEHPHHKSLARFMAINFSTYFDGTYGWWSKELQDIANFDFKMVQSLYRQEMIQISRWWEEIGLSKELKFARNQSFKWYLWAMAILTDPNLSEQRIDLTKLISFIYIIDDIFDVHASLTELMQFAQVIDRWDIAASEQLPEYMRICFKALDKITNEISFNIYKQHGFDAVDSLRKTWGTLCKAFLVEARWFSSGKIPNTEEYLKNGITSSGVNVALVHIFFLLGHGLNTDAVNSINDNPAIISSAATILRLWDDLGSAKDENQDGHDGSYVECYMKENIGCSVEKARKQVIEMISDSWKKLNQECLNPSPFSSTYRKCCLNLARMVPLMYTYDHNQGLPLLQQHINSLFDL